MRKYNRGLENRTRNLLIYESYTEQLENGLENEMELQKRREEELAWMEYEREHGARLSISDYKELHKECEEFIKLLDKLSEIESRWHHEDETGLDYGDEDEYYADYGLGIIC